MANQISELDQGVRKELESLFQRKVCNPEDIDSRALSELGSLRQADAIESLARLEQAITKTNIRSISGYLIGVTKRFSHPKSSRPPPPSSSLLLIEPAQRILDRLCSYGVIRPGEIDTTLAKLVSRSPEFQILVMDTFQDKHLKDVRNMGGFFAAHVRAVDEDLERGRLSLPILRSQNHDHRHDHRDSYRSSRDAFDEGPARRDHHQQRPYSSDHTDRHHGGGFDRGHRYDRDDGRGGYDDIPPAPVRYYQGPSANDPYTASPPPVRQQQQQHPVPSGMMGTRDSRNGGPLPPRHFATEQGQWGVRTDEFQNLSKFAKFVFPAAALHLQQLWDVEENKLVSVLDDASWQELASLEDASSVKVVEEVALAMKNAPDDIRTLNAIFMTHAAKYPKRADAPTLTNIESAVPASSVAPLLPPGSFVLGQEGRSAVPAISSPASGGRGAAPVQYDDPRRYGNGRPPPSEFLPPPRPRPAPPIQLPGPAGTLSPAIQAEIDDVIQKMRGLIKLDHFTERVVNSLHGAKESNILRAFEDFKKTNPNSMKNPMGYLIGCLKNCDRGFSASDRGSSRGDGSGRGRRYEPY